MLKSLFESSIDKLHIPADMKDAIKQINNICLEAEGDDKEKAADKNDKPLMAPGPEVEKAKEEIAKEKAEKEKTKKDLEAYETKRKEMEAKGQEPENPIPSFDANNYDFNIKLPEGDNIPTTIDDVKSEKDVWKVLQNLQKKAVANKGTAEGEKWRQKLEDEYWKATNDRNFKRVKGFELTINNPEYKKAKTDDKAAETKPAEQPAQAAGTQPAQPAQATGEQPAKNAETKTAEQPAQTTGAQPAQNAEGQQAQAANGQPAQNAEGQQAQAADGKAAEQPAAAQQNTTARRGADVATVQYFLQSALPNSNIVADGILGPKTITAIQQKEDIDTTGKMDKNTQDAFNKLLAEAKKKVIPLQEKLGVTADGLIGKQTLQAMAKQNMNVTNVFSKDVKNANTPAANTQVATKKADVNLLDTPFDAAKADKALASKEITKAEYNTWKEFGISPEHQRNNPKETKAECIRLAHYPPAERQQVIQERLAKNDPKTGAQSKQAQPTGADKFKPQNEEEQKFYDKTVQNYINVYKKMGSDDQAAAKQAERVAQNHLVKYRNGTLPKAQMPKDVKPAVGVGNDNNVAEVAANVKGPKDDAEKKFFNQTKANWTKVYAEKFKNDPSRVEPAAEQQARIELMKYRARMAQAARKNGQQQAANQGNTQPAQQQAQKQPAPQGNQQQAAAPQQNNQNNEVYHTTKDSKGTTEYYSGNISWANLSPEEKKIKEDAEAKEQAKYYDGKQVKKNPKTGKPYDEQIVLHRIQSAGQNAVIKNRMAKARERQAASGKQG